jgi:riboflavin synthase alpha subunit
LIAKISLNGQTSLEAFLCLDGMTSKGTCINVKDRLETHFWAQLTETGVNKTFLKSLKFNALLESNAVQWHPQHSQLA